MFQMDFDFYDLPSSNNEPTCSQSSSSQSSSGSGSSLLPSSGELFLPSPKLKSSSSSKPAVSYFSVPSGQQCCWSLFFSLDTRSRFFSTPFIWYSVSSNFWRTIYFILVRLLIQISCLGMGNRNIKFVYVDSCGLLPIITYRDFIFIVCFIFR